MFVAGSVALLAPVAAEAQSLNEAYDPELRRYDGRGWRCSVRRWSTAEEGRAGGTAARLGHDGRVAELKGERLSELTARRPLPACPPTLPDKPFRVSLQLPGCTDHLLRIKQSPARRVEQIWPYDHCFVTRLDGPAATHAFRSVYAPHSHHASARCAVVACTIGHFKPVAAAQAKCRHCDDLVRQSKR